MSSVGVLQDVFPAEAELEAAGTPPAVALVSEWPSDDSADEDFDPEKEYDDTEEGDSDREQSAAAQGWSRWVQFPS